MQFHSDKQVTKFSEFGICNIAEHYIFDRVSSLTFGAGRNPLSDKVGDTNSLTSLKEIPLELSSSSDLNIPDEHDKRN